MSKTNTSAKAPRPYFRKYAVPDAPAASAQTRASGWMTRGAIAITAFAMIFSVFAPAVQAVGAPYGTTVMDKIVLCHWDASAKPDPAYKSSGDVSVNSAINGHGGHADDIIPPFYYKDGKDTAFYPGKNWTDANEDIWNSNGTENGGCLGDGIIPTTGTLIVKKVVVNDNGGNKSAANFSFKVNGGTSTAFEADGQNDIVVTPGTFSVVEVADSGYATTYSNCSNLNIAAGQTATCTITNNDIAVVTPKGSLTITKNTVGGNGTFSFSGTGPSTVTNFTITTVGNTGSQTINNLTPGSYTITETGSPDANWSKTGDTCTSVTVVADQTATCTITNTHTTPRTSGTLTVKKVIVGDQSAAASDFSFQVNGGSAIGFEADGQNDMTVAAGNYTITEVAASGFTTTYDNCSEVTLVVDGNVTCTITNTKIVTPKYSLSGKVYNDNNTQNGELDVESEAGLAGWTVNLYVKGNGSVFNTTETNGSGDYSFTNLDAGCYIVKEVLQSGWNETDPTVADDAAQGVVTDYEYQVALGGASCADVSFLDQFIGLFINTANAIAVIPSSVDNLNFGNVQIPSGCTSNCGGGGGGGSSINNVLGGFKYNDLNKNGVRDNGEAGLAGWTIYLDVNGNDTFDNGEAFRTTAADGSYSFNNLNPGTYTVREVNQSGWTQYEPGTGAGSEWTVNVTSSSSKSDANFGNAQGTVLGDSTTVPSVPTPRVLGAELPRTGMNVTLMVILGSIVAAAAILTTRKLKVGQE